MSRVRALKLNMLATIASELVTLVIGLVLPRLMIVYFGSACNGLVCSIAQFLGFSALFRAGIGGAVRASLYKPIAEKDCSAINEILSATSAYMHKIGFLIAIYLGLFALIYPFMVGGEIDWLFSFTLVLIMGFTAFADNFWGIKCKILLQADQKFYVEITSALVANALSGLLSVILIVNGFSIHVVKLVATVAFLINPIFLNVYVKRHYSINWNVAAKNTSIKNRWNAFFQQVASIFNQNVALVLLTILQPLKEISVYTIHLMVVGNIGKIVNSCVSGINSTYGDMIAKNEMQNLKKKFFFTEWMLFAICEVFFSVTAVMLPSFVALYTKSVNDANYIRPFFALIMVVAFMMSSVRIPYQMLVEAAGRFKETRNGSILEVLINVLSSVVFIKFCGLIGVLYGMITSCAIRTLEYGFFCMKEILNINRFHVIKHFIVVLVTFLICTEISKLFISNNIENFYIWCVNSAGVLVSSVLIVFFVSVFFYKECLYMFVNRMKMRLKK